MQPVLVASAEQKGFNQGQLMQRLKCGLLLDVEPLNSKTSGGSFTKEEYHNYRGIFFSTTFICLFSEQWKFWNFVSITELDTEYCVVGTGGVLSIVHINLHLLNILL